MTQTIARVFLRIYALGGTSSQRHYLGLAAIESPLAGPGARFITNEKKWGILVLGQLSSRALALADR